MIIVLRNSLEFAVFTVILNVERVHKSNPTQTVLRVINISNNLIKKIVG